MSRGLFPSVNNFVNKNLGLNNETVGRGQLSRSEDPWGETVGDDVFFPTSKILPENWNKTFPYRLVVVDANSKGNPIVAGLSGRSSKAIDTSFFTSGSDYVISQRIADSRWIFELPITPQQIQIVDQYAINTVATARGVLEEHNGIKFKMISISATTGIFPSRSSTGAGVSNPQALGSVFGGALQAAQNLNNSAGRLKSAFTGENPNSSQSAGYVNSYLTGYYQALFLSNFLERYSQEKKKPQNKGWRLVLDIPKMGTSYVVTPINFALQKSVQSPNEFKFSLQLKAWKRIKISSSGEISEKTQFKLKTNDFQRIANTLRETRRTLSNATNLLKAVRSDFQTPLNLLRQAALAVKDVAGIVYTAADLPGNIVNDISSSIKQSLAITSSAFIRGTNQPAVPLTISLNSQQDKSSFIAASIRSEQGVNEGLSINQLEAGDLGTEAAQSASLRGSSALFERPEEFFDTLDSLDIDSLPLTPDQRDRIQNEIELASLTTVDTFNTIKTELLNTALLISNNYGAGDEVYSTIYNRPPPKQRSTPLTIEETEVITAVFESISALDELTASRFFDDLKIESPLDYVGGLAADAEIDFETSGAKILVPVPFGLTIEQIAARYLRDANRWLEIVTLNRLRLPYIDEVGFSYKLLSNGSGRQVTVNDQDRRLFIGQFVVFSSSNVPSFRRKIINVERISDTNYLVTVDGDSDLEKLTTLASASLKGYAPGTVNSQNQIFIPSDGTPPEDDLVNLPKRFQEDNLAKISKVDWLLTDNGDLAINQAGEIQLAGGLTNLIQALRLKLRTKKGTLLQDLDYGLGLEHGISTADVESGELVQSLNKLIQDDSRFDGINRLNIRIQGSTMFVDLSVNLAGGSGVLPITFEV